MVLNRPMSWLTVASEIAGRRHACADASDVYLAAVGQQEHQADASLRSGAN